MIANFCKVMNRLVLSTALFSCLNCYAQDTLQDVLPFPEVGPIVRNVTTDEIIIMGQGDRHKDALGAYRFAKITDDHKESAFSIPQYFGMDENERNVGHAFLSKLDPDTLYKIQIGFVTNGADISSVNWDNAHTLSIRTLSTSPSDTFSFQLGSCRRLGEILGASVWRKKGDKIFQAMLKDIQIVKSSGGKTNFIAFIGDQIYADATHPFGDCTTFEEYAARYELAFSQKFIRALMGAETPVYMVRDDHEWWNDANREEQDLRPEQDLAAKLAYDLFQRPRGKKTENWWYTVSNDVELFFTDTRSEREPSNNQIMSREQLTALKDWLGRKEVKNKIKIIVSSVPMLLLDTEDSWGGYKAQLYDLLNHITTNKIKYTMIISGDAHCENDALFKITDIRSGKEKGQILEVLVSGLFAVARNKAGKLSDQMDLSKFGIHAQATTKLQPTITENLFARITGNHALKTVNIAIYNKDNELLKSSFYNLKTGESIIEQTK